MFAESHLCLTRTACRMGFNDEITDRLILRIQLDRLPLFRYRAAEYDAAIFSNDEYSIWQSAE